MTTVTRICDRCKKQVANADDLNTLRLSFTNPRQYSYSGGTCNELSSTIPNVEWCKPCCEESGFVQYKTSTIEKATPSFEEMLREMVETAVAERVSN